MRAREGQKAAALEVLPALAALPSVPAWEERTTHAPQSSIRRFQASALIAVARLIIRAARGCVLSLALSVPIVAAKPTSPRLR